MKISKAHQQFADYLNNPRALDYPEEFLGPNWREVLNFWLYLENLTEEKWNNIVEKIPGFNLNNSYSRIKDPETEEYFLAEASFYYSNSDSLRVIARIATVYAVRELINSHILKEQNKPLAFLSLFDYQPESSVIHT